ncbi:MAG: putative toxin-antitoxin system toxin component, PIN family [Spirochaetota bacterium]
MKIVLDTNVLISALLNPEGIPAVLLSLIVNGKLKLLYDNRILSEYFEVLNRKKFNFKSEWIEPLIDFIRNEGEFIIANPVFKSFKDKDDIKFYEVAKSGNAKYIITGNINHFPKEDLIKTPAEFLNIYTRINKQNN